MAKSFTVIRLQKRISSGTKLFIQTIRYCSLNMDYAQWQCLIGIGINIPYFILWLIFKAGGSVFENLERYKDVPQGPRGEIIIYSYIIIYYNNIIRRYDVIYQLYFAL